MNIEWEALGAVAAVSLVICVLVVVLVSLALVALPTRPPDLTGGTPGKALVIGGGASGLSHVTGTVIAGACLLGAATIVLYGFYLLIL